MRKALVLALAMALVGGVAYANWCARDVVPAATILIPYVEVSVDPDTLEPIDGQTTVVDVINVSEEPVIIHITVWDINSDPQIDFDEVLTGYDKWQINWRDFIDGNFGLFDTYLNSHALYPLSGNLTWSPHEWGPNGRRFGGVQSDAQDTPDPFDACDPPPYGNRPDLKDVIQTKLAGAMINYYMHDEGCGDLRTDLAWFGEGGFAPLNTLEFWVSIDTVFQCGLDFPDEAEYWTNPTIAPYNVLLAEWYRVNSLNQYSEAYNPPHIEAASEGLTVDGVNFYENNNADRIDWNSDREPLATAFAFDYFDGYQGLVNSHVMVWKNQEETYSAGGAWWIDDCDQYLYYAWDEHERSLSREVDEISGIDPEGEDPNQFPFNTQKVPLTRAYFDLPGTFGWFLLVFPPSYDAAHPDRPADATDDDWWKQAWAGTIIDYVNYSMGLNAAVAFNAHCFIEDVLPFYGNVNVAKVPNGATPSPTP